MGVTKAQLLENAPGAKVLRMVSGEECSRAQGPEGMVDDRAGCFGCHALAPLPGVKLEAQLEDPGRKIVRLQATAAQELAAVLEEDRPILHPPFPLPPALRLHALPHR